MRCEPPKRGQFNQPYNTTHTPRQPTKYALCGTFVLNISSMCGIGIVPNIGHIAYRSVAYIWTWEQ